jgi:hypothetical protein
LVLLLSGCALFQTERERCGSTIDKVWEELDVGKVEGFAALVSYGRAAALLAQAKVDQTQENFAACIEGGERARFYIKESRAGR